MGQVFQVVDDGKRVDAHYEIDGESIIFHSRGGTKGKGAINTEYSRGLAVLLKTLESHAIGIKQIWVDSSQVQSLSIEDRTIFGSSDEYFSAHEALRLMALRMKTIGRPSSASGGNSTRRIRIRVGSEHAALLGNLLGGLPVNKDSRSLDRIPSEDLRRVTAEHVWLAIEEMLSGAETLGFGPSTDYDLLIDTDQRLPPKAVFGLAASKALGFNVLPRHFTAGLGSVCFEVLEGAGFNILPKDAFPNGPVPTTISEDQSWTEGQPRLIEHLYRERARGAAQAKKEQFRRLHQRLFCERCMMDPVKTYGEKHGEACIEVHHRQVQVSAMDPGHMTSLNDLQCLCANCHRVVHRELKELATT
ncbi:HNH endonuclease [Pseudomonas sp. microsymbiont 2]